MDSSEAIPQRSFWSRRGARLGPVVLTCEHASPRLPPGLASDAASRRLLGTHWGVDLGGWALALELSRRLDAGLIGGAWTRLAIDLNRAPGDPTLARPIAGDVAVRWNRRLGVNGLLSRIDRWHTPYHAEVDRRITRHLLLGIHPLILSIHTFTPELDGERRPFQIGVLFREHDVLGRALARRIRTEGLSVRLNQPYSGIDGLMYSAERHGSHHRLPCLELEINQALFAKRGVAAGLGSALARAVAGLKR